MKGIPSVELLQSTHRFPGPYVFKIIGQNSETFKSDITSALKGALESSTDPHFQSRETAEGRHVSMTFELIVPSAEKVITAYKAIGAVKGVVMML